MLQVDAGQALEQLHGHVRRGADARRAVGELPGLLLRERDQLGDGVCAGTVGLTTSTLGAAAAKRDRRKVAHGIVGYLLVHDAVERERARNEQQRVAVGRGARDALDADHVAGAGPVLHVELLADGVGEILREHTGDDVGAARRRRRHHDAHRPRRIVGLGLRLPGQSTNQCDQQNSNLHGALPRVFGNRPQPIAPRSLPARSTGLAATSTKATTQGSVPGLVQL